MEMGHSSLSWDLSIETMKDDSLQAQRKKAEPRAIQVGDILKQTPRETKGTQRTELCGGQEEADKGDQRGAR